MFKSVDTFPRTQNYVNGILVNIDKIANILMDNILPVMIHEDRKFKMILDESICLIQLKN